jgi:hypothetical protein
MDAVVGAPACHEPAVNNSLARTAHLFLVVGLALLAGAVYWASRVEQFARGASIAHGTVIQLEHSRSSNSSSYYPVVKYRTAAGREATFRSSFGSNPPSHAVGEAVVVLYDESDPSDARIRSFFSLWGGATLVGSIGAVFALVGGGMLYGRRRAAERAKYLRRHGMPVQTEYQSVEINTTLRVNGRHPWRIVTQWKNPTSGELHLFRSANLWFDPTTHINTQQITVYLDRRNPKRYHMDTAFLPKLADA